ncbi:hypothetical protein [Streptomyces chartreusis]|uniref:hypothetical protein n=1 Tax=Streptomyces chartreusis TaxID=1969 RepID=UPI0037FA5652
MKGPQQLSAAAPLLPSAIRIDTQWCWDPLYPHLRRRVRIVETRWDGETWWIKTEALSDSGGWPARSQRLHTLDNFIESTVAVDDI